ncbi:methyltransferase domain-containing protein [Polynucleobacter sp. MG-5-Ahmo-C2]|uniref:class I SAM-dependent methyltransferase n=1 Tax=Polynucleobacter sp. MG-5-Ahmo-C2 TaxID=2081051 RepID=UPI001BFEAB7B|nr:class I SAM-dependent methyltransferase [Polynucleobacter sp. MG-5-Ahmo-C2]QWD98815.1 methyltransferase domain-containing protein [Polynucleobacter sp. MG-5-Ahmo-C2]
MNNESYIKYDRHEEEWDEILTNPLKQQIGATWFKHNTLDAWRHRRMHFLINPIISYDKSFKWLTVGDGRYGTDAHFLLSSGIQKVHCSDYSDTLLTIAHEKGFISEYSAQNAESLKFDDNSFDFIYCKEALHHFPRPYMALYEMLRVCKTAVILTEPRDQLIDKAPLLPLFRLLKKLTKNNTGAHSFETVGNYVYTISERELSKFLLGMHYNCIAFTGVNDHYIPGVEFIDIDPKNFKHKFIKLKTVVCIKIRDLLCFLGFMKTNLLTVALFKQRPTQDLINSMSNHGWTIQELPQNPYL